MNEQQAWLALEQYIADSGLPYTTSLAKYHDSRIYNVQIEATFDSTFGFDVIHCSEVLDYGSGETVLEALLSLLKYLDLPETKEIVKERKQYYDTVTATRS